MLSRCCNKMRLLSTSYRHESQKLTCCLWVYSTYFKRVPHNMCLAGGCLLRGGYIAVLVLPMYGMHSIYRFAFISKILDK